MNSRRARDDRLEHRTFVVLLAAITLALAWVLAPFAGAILWAVAIAILFAPVQRRMLARMNGRAGLAALATIGLVVVLVIVPLVVIGMALAREGATVLQLLESGQLDFGRQFERALSSLPSWLGELLDRVGLGDLRAIQQKVGAVAAQGSRALASRALDIGQNTLDVVVGFFVMLYVGFYFLRDGEELVVRLRRAVPLEPDVRNALFTAFAAVVRATVKGNVLVALAQGGLGGLAFWFLDLRAPVLWGTLMAFLSLLPAIGAALVWLPVGLWLLFSGETWQGVGLIVWGTLVIGLVDNLLRPILVGKDIRMPDWLVLVSTLGGMALLGINGFVVGPMVAALFLAAWGIYAGIRPEP